MFQTIFPCRSISCSVSQCLKSSLLKSPLDSLVITIQSCRLKKNSSDADNNKKYPLVTLKNVNTRKSNYILYNNEYFMQS